MPHILNNGAAWYKAMSLLQPEEHRHQAVLGLRQHPATRQLRESPWDFPSGSSCTSCAAVRFRGRQFKAMIPGGSSVPILTPEEAEARTAWTTRASWRRLHARLGRRDRVSTTRRTWCKQIARLARFYAHESCAQCTQCREGTAWTTRILERIVAGEGHAEDLDTLLSLAENMTGKTICVLSDSCATPVVSGIQKFRDEFEALITAQRSRGAGRGGGLMADRLRWSHSRSKGGR